MATFYEALSALHDRYVGYRENGSLRKADQLENVLVSLNTYIHRYNTALSLNDADEAALMETAIIEILAGENLTVDPGNGLPLAEPSLQLSRDNILIPFNNTGVGNFSLATSALYIFLNGEDVTSDWSFAKVDSGVTSSINISNEVVVTDISSNLGYVEVTASKSGYSDVVKRIFVYKTYTENSVYVDVDRNIAIVPTNPSGNEEDLSGAIFNIKIYEDGIDVTSSWSIAKNDNNITTSLSGTTTKTVTVTAIAADYGYTDVTLSKSGYASIIKRLSANKAKINKFPVYTVDKESSAIQTNPSGNEEDLSDAVFNIKIYENGSDVTSSWSAVKADSNITTTLSGTTTKTVTTTSISSDSGYSEITLSRSGYADIVRRVYVYKAKSIKIPVVSITNDVIAVPSDIDGSNPIFVNAASGIDVYEDGVQVTNQWSLAKVDSNVTSVTSGVVTKVVSITAMSADSGSVAITLSRTGYADIERTIYVYKVRNGVQGVVASASPSSLVVPSDNDYDNPVLTGAISTLTVYLGDTDDTSNWSFVVASVTNVTASISMSNQLNIDTFAAPNSYGEVTVTASRSGYDDIDIRVSVAKARTGAVPSGAAISSQIHGDGTTLSITTDGTYTMNSGDSYTLVDVDIAGSTGATTTLNLPTPNSSNDGRILVVDIEMTESSSTSQFIIRGDETGSGSVILTIPVTTSTARYMYVTLRVVNSAWAVLSTGFKETSNQSLLSFLGLYTNILPTRLNIGNWDMNFGDDGTLSVSVAHNLSVTTHTIMHVSVIIYDDSGGQHAFTNDQAGSSIVIDSTNVVLTISAADYFDDSSFATTPYNRGYIYILRDLSLF